MSRLARRAWLAARLPILLTEAAYHRTHDAEEGLRAVAAWRLDAPEGRVTLEQIDSVLARADVAP
jgi:hypothetical protein